MFWIIIPIIFGTVIAALTGVFDDFVKQYDYSDEIDNLDSRISGNEKLGIQLDIQKNWTMEDQTRQDNIISENQHDISNNEKKICKLSNGDLCD